MFVGTSGYQCGWLTYQAEDIIINLPIEGKITREYWDNKEHYLKVVNNNPLEFIHHFWK